MKCLKHTVLITLVISLNALIACTKLGSVPEFEYTYDFDASLPDINVSGLRAETVNITPGSINSSGYSDFVLAIPATATDVASAVNTAFTPAQQAYWAGQTQPSILALLEADDATVQSQVRLAILAFLSNPTLVSLVPELADAAGGLLSNSRRLGSHKHYGQQFELLFVQLFLAQTDELDDCRQAANDAFDAALDEIDDQLAQQLNDIQTQFNTQVPLVEAQRADLESAAGERHSIRLADYLNFYNTTATNISTLFSNGSITAAERDLLNIVNLAVYAAYVDASLTLEDNEFILINDLLSQTSANLIVNRDDLVIEANNNYDDELSRLTSIRNSTVNACHNQGGANVS